MNSKFPSPLTTDHLPRYRCPPPLLPAFAIAPTPRSVPPIPPPRENGYTATTAVPLYWAIYGPAGAPRLLALHGGPGAHHDYLLPQMLRLADEYELVFYDQRGGGRSRADDRAAITARTQVDDLRLVVEELSLDPLSLLGYSWGGLLALLYAIEASTAGDAIIPRRLVLIDPAPLTRQYRTRFEDELARRQESEEIRGLRDELAGSGLRESDPEQYRQRLFEVGVAGYFADPAAARDLTQFRVMGRVQQSVWESLGDYDVVSRLQVVTCPTLIVHGREDPIPVESSVQAAQALGTRARLVVLERSGHVPYVEQPDALFAVISRFLQDTADLATE